GDAVVEHRAVVAAGLVAERAGEPTFAEAGLADDDQVLAPGNPIAGGKLCKQRLVEGADLGVEVLNGSSRVLARTDPASDQRAVKRLDGRDIALVWLRRAIWDWAKKKALCLNRDQIKESGSPSVFITDKGRECSRLPSWGHRQAFRRPNV